VRRTKTEVALAEAQLAHADDPERSDLLARARRFKASWIELAEALSAVRRRETWRRWGYDSFDAYARRELHLRQETADKLTASFVFLKRSAPEVLRRDGLSSPIPGYQAVDFLRRAEEREGVPREVVDEIRSRVLEDGARVSALARRYRDMVFPEDQADRARREAMAMRAAARRLAEMLGQTSAVPRRLAAEVREALERLLEALGEDESE
jgi:hypothetical protein